MGTVSDLQASHVCMPKKLRAGCISALCGPERLDLSKSMQDAQTYMEM